MKQQHLVELLKQEGATVEHNEIAHVVQATCKSGTRIEIRNNLLYIGYNGIEFCCSLESTMLCDSPQQWSSGAVTLTLKCNDSFITFRLA